MALTSIFIPTKTIEREKIVIEKVTVPNLDGGITINLSLSKKEAEQLLDMCNKVGGMAKTTLRGLFSDKPSSLKKLLEDAGIQCSDSTDGSIYFNTY